MDRVHRIGQTKECHIYRLVCSNTIEERILLRAQQKHVIQNTVYAGGFKMAADTLAVPPEGKTDLADLFGESELIGLIGDQSGGSSNAPSATMTETRIAADTDATLINRHKHARTETETTESAKRQKQEGAANAV
jgi:hypothetical protein